MYFIKPHGGGDVSRNKNQLEVELRRSDMFVFTLIQHIAPLGLE